jgi:hypothetical protein
VRGMPGWVPHWVSSAGRAAAANQQGCVPWRLRGMMSLPACAGPRACPKADTRAALRPPWATQVWERTPVLFVQGSRGGVCMRAVRAADGVDGGVRLGGGGLQNEEHVGHQYGGRGRGRDGASSKAGGCCVWGGEVVCACVGKGGGGGPKRARGPACRMRARSSSPAPPAPPQREGRVHHAVHRGLPDQRPPGAAGRRRGGPHGPVPCRGGRGTRLRPRPLS